MVSKEQAEEMAKQLIPQYLKDCQPDTNLDAGNALASLILVAGVGMVTNVGYYEAVYRLNEMVALIEKRMVGMEFIYPGRELNKKPDLTGI